MSIATMNRSTSARCSGCQTGGPSLLQAMQAIEAPAGVALELPERAEAASFAGAGGGN